MTSDRPRIRRLLPSANLLLAALQLLLLPLVAGGKLLSFFGWLTLDALSLALGVAWSLVIGLLLLRHRRDDAQAAALSWQPLLVSLGLPLIAYAGNGAALAAGVALAGGGVWQSLLRTGNKADAAVLRYSVPIAAVLLLAATAPPFGETRALQPPAGGATGPWNPLAVVAATVAVMITAWCWPFHYRRTQAGDSSSLAGASLMSLYSLAGVALLARMLVAAPWPPVAAWTMVGLGMMALLVGAYALYASDGGIGLAAPVLTGTAITGLGMASTSPAATAGAIWVLLAGLLTVATGQPSGGSISVRNSRVLVLLAPLPGVWLISQGALDTGYWIVAVFLLPAYALVTLQSAQRVETHPPNQAGKARILVQAAATLLAACAVLSPQLPLVWVVRPMVGAMAGGVGAMARLDLDWGVGLMLRSAQETVSAGLPATGVAVGVFLAAVALYWLKQLLGLLVRNDPEDGHAG